jgi:Trypsin
MTRWLLVLAAVGWLLVLALAGCVAPPGSRAQAIIGGSDDAHDEGVVFLMIDWGFGQTESCTAEVISPHVILTAGHCVTPDPQQPFVGQPSFAISGAAVVSPFQPPPDLQVVTEVKAHPAFDLATLQSGSFGVHDLAVGLLKDAAPVNPYPYNRGNLPQVGAPTRLVGYGLSDPQLQTGAGTRRETTTPLSDFDGDRLHFADGQHQACNGDSGGPAFQTLGGVEEIIGVTSGGDDSCTQGGDYTRIDVNHDFIDSFVQMHDPGFLPSPMPDLGTTLTPVVPDLAGPPPPPDLAAAPDLALPGITLPSRPTAPMAAGGCDILPHPAPDGLWVVLLLAVALRTSRPSRWGTRWSGACEGSRSRSARS